MNNLQPSNLQTFKLGLIGYPLTHTLSPKIHAAAFSACGLQGSYVPFPIRPNDKDSLQAILHRLRTGDLHGLNVTIPHKQTVIEYLDELTPTAQSIGAVNTLYLRDGKLIGGNTDAPGFLTDLKRAFEFSSFSLHPSALVLGAGGSARAVVYALLTDGWNVTLAARRPEQAQHLAASFPNYQPALSIVEGLPITNLQTFQLSTFNLLVNTTPLGMTPNIETSPLPENAILAPGAIVYDLVYNPRETRLMRQAKAQGCRAVSGLGMLIEQAALAFEMWTGCRPPHQTLWNAVES